MAMESKVGVSPLLLAWTVTAIAYGAKALFTAATAPLVVDTDDAMRLTEVRDFLGGQNWFDLVEHRLNTPYGGLIHWSRLVDLPEATLLSLTRLLFGAAGDTIFLYAWPLLLLLPLLWLMGRLALRLGGPEAVLPGLFLPALSLATLSEFAPGRLDHHAFQILLSLVMLWGALAVRSRPAAALAAGLAAAAALAIGIEALPTVLATLLVFGLSWVADPRHGKALRDFGLSFACGMALALAQGVPPGRWLAPMFDAISIVYATAAVLCALAFVVLPMLPLRSLWTRLGVGVVAGGVVAGVVVALWPAILKGPYGMLDPWLIANWLNHIAEAEPWLTSFYRDPVYPIAIVVPPLVALGFAIWNIVRNHDRESWLIYAGILAITLAITFLQIRAGRLAAPLAVPGCAALIAAAWRSRSPRRRLIPGLVVALGWFVSAGIGVAAVVVVAAPDTKTPDEKVAAAGRQACILPAAFNDLARLPPARIMTPIDLGSHVLAFTHHSVVAAPYHRNQEAILDAFHFFNEPIDAARNILESRGVTLVVICPQMREIRGMVDHAPDSFVSLYAANELPGWLVDESKPHAALKVYAVAPR
jgi:hypothetical protein